MPWSLGQPWRVVDSLQVLYSQVRAYAPRSVPPATDVNAWGSIGDTAHASSSDHYPHYYAVLGSIAVVCARDFPHAPALGLDGGVVTEALRVSRDPRIGYIIFNRRITGPNHGWAWDSYGGSDPHDTHFHVSSVHTAVADDPRPWALPGGDEMEIGTAIDVPNYDADPALPQVEHTNVGTALGVASQRSWQALAAARRVEAKVDQLLARPAATVDVQALAAALAPLLGVDQAAVVAALQSDAGRAALEEAAFQGSQRAERE